MAESGKKILLSGVKPTGKPHIGNYFGAMRQFVELQNEYKSYIFIADLHALTTIRNKKELEENIIGVALDYLAIGIDSKKVTLYKQSDIPAHTELAWIFNCITPIPRLTNAHAYKDALAKMKANIYNSPPTLSYLGAGKSAEQLDIAIDEFILSNMNYNVGLFDYPILMAADILLYGPDVVPVGADQKQHVEIARDTARKFNQIFGDTFKEPKELILENVKVVPGTDGQKMSKSYNNTIPLFATDDEIRKAVMSIPTDSKGIDEPKSPDEDKVFALHKLFTTGPEFEEVHDKYVNGGMSYKDSKEILIKNISAFIAPMRERRKLLAQDTDTVLNILKEGGERAKAVAEKKMMEVKEKIGVKLY